MSKYDSRYSKVLTVAYVVLVVALIGLASVAMGAEYRGYDDPYYIFKDGDKIRYCMEWEPGAKYTTCWSLGVPTLCDITYDFPPDVDCSTLGTGPSARQSS
jgi:hypothetical protein